MNDYKVNTSQTLEDFDTGLATAVQATAEQIWQENPTQAITRMVELQSERERQQTTQYSDFRPPQKLAEPEKKMSKQDAEKRVSEAGVSLSIGEDGISKRKLDILIKRKREEVKRKAIIETAPDGFISGAAQVGTGLAVSLADPLGIAASFIPVVGQARYAKALAGAASAGGRFGVRAGVGAVEGAVGAAVLEPLVLMASAQDQADYGLYDSFLNLTFGAVLGGGLHSVGGAIGDILSKSSPQAKSDLLQGAVARALEDRPIDVSHIAKADPSFRAAWREAEIQRVIDGDIEANPAVRTEFNRIMDEITPEFTAKLKAQGDEVSMKAVAEIEAGRPPQALIEKAAAITKDRIGDFEPTAKFDTNAVDLADFKASKEAQDFIDNAVEETPEYLDSVADDIIKGLDDAGFDTTGLKTELAELNKSIELDAKGIEAGVMCALGR